MSDPYQVLGITRKADDATVRAAYLAAVRISPPDRDAERFAALRRAYDAVATHRLRLAHDLFDRTPPSVAGVLHLLESEFSPRRPDASALLRVLKDSCDGH